MTDRFVIIPTRAGLFPGLEKLLDAVAGSGAIAVVVTNFGHTINYQNTVCVPREKQNFQHWVNLGLHYALDNSEDSFALLVTDDILISAGGLDDIFNQADGADVISMDDRPYVPWSPMTGWLFGVRPGSMWLDESFTYWWGDDDFWIRADRDPSISTRLIHADYVHNRGEKRDWDVEFDSVAAPDRGLFFERYPEFRPENLESGRTEWT